MARINASYNILCIFCLLIHTYIPTYIHHFLLLFVLFRDIQIAYFVLMAFSISQHFASYSAMLGTLLLVSVP